MRVVPGHASATTPASRRIPVPELPRSISSGGRGQAGPAAGRPSTRSPSSRTSAPSAVDGLPGPDDVVAPGQPGDGRGALGQGGQQQGPVGDGLVAGHADGARAAGGRRAPRGSRWAGPVTGAVPIGVMLDRWPRAARATVKSWAPAGVDDHDQDAAVAFHRVGDLEVEDVDAELGGQDRRSRRGRRGGPGRGCAPRPAPRAGAPGRSWPGGRWPPAAARRAASRGPARPPGGAWPRGSRSAGRGWPRWPAALSSQMPGQMVGCPAAMRVMSRKPPAASCRSAPCSSPSSAARAIRVAAVRWGTWDTTATSVSCSLGVEGDHVGPELGQHGAHPGVGGGVGGGRRGEHPGGAHEQLGRGPLDADLLAPGHGVAADEAGPVDGGHQRALDAAHVGDHGVRVPRRATTGCSATTSAATWTGVATTTRSASRSSPSTSRAPSSTARAAVPGVASVPLTCQPWARSAMPTEPPMRPVPMTMARPGAPVRGGRPLSRGGRHGAPGRPRGRRGGCRPSGASVVTCSMTRMQRGTDPTMASSRAQISGTAPRPMVRAAVAGKIDTMSSVAVKRIDTMSSSTRPLRSMMRVEQGHHPLGDGLGGVLVDGGGAADGSQGGWHQAGMLARGRDGRPAPGRPAGPAGCGPPATSSAGTAAAARPRTSSKVSGR